MTDRATDDGLPGLRLEFLDPADPARWVRVTLVRLPHHYKRWLEGCARLLYKLQTDRNFLWLVRPDRVDPGLRDLKPPQTFARALPPADHTRVRALLRLLERKDRYPEDVWRAKGERVLADEVGRTYLGAVLAQARKAMTELQSSPPVPESVPANEP